MANLKIGSNAALDKNGFIQNYPVGSIVIRANSTIDDGWLLCDGRPVANTDYPELLNHLSNEQKILASDAATSNYFGASVALSSDGNTAIVGAYGNDASFADDGAAYVFTRSGGVWTQQQKLVASDAESYGDFGYSVDLSSDGNTAAIGAEGSTAVYVFTRSGGVWTEQQKLVASDAQEFTSSFGGSVSLSGDGNTVLIGAALHDTAPAVNSGAAYVFTRSGGVWTQQRNFISSDIENDRFGFSVALSSDGNTAAIGAHLEDTSPNTDNGAVYVYSLASSLPYGGSFSTFNLPPLVYNVTNNPNQRMPFSTISAEATYPNVFTHNHTVGINATSFDSYNHVHNHNSNTSASRSDTMSHNHGSIDGNTASSNNPVNPNAANLFSPGRLAGPAGPYASANTSATLNHVHAGGAWNSATQNSATSHTHNVNIHTQTNYSHSHNTNMANLSHSVNSSSSYPLSKQVYFLIKT